MTAQSLSRRFVLGTGIAAGMALGLGGCSWGRQPTSTEGNTRLSSWDSFTVQPGSAAVDKLHKAFLSTHEGAEIDRNTVAFDQMVALSKTALASGSGPDLVYYSVGKGNAGILVDAGLIAPLDDVAAEVGWKESIAPFAIREATFDDKLYGLPHESEVSGWWYNQSLFDKHSLQLPETIDDLLALTKKAKKLGLIPVAYGQGDGYPPFWLFSQIACNVLQSEPLGQLVYDNEGEWNTPEIIAGIQTVFGDLNKAGTFGGDVNSLKAQDAQDMWVAEEALMLVGGSWASGTFADAFPDKKIGIAPLPSLDDEHRVFSAGSGGAYWLSADANEPELAKEFLKFVFSDEAVKIWVEDADLVPPVEFDSSGWDVSVLQQTINESVSGGDDPALNLGYQVNHGLASAPFLNMMTAGFQAMIAGDKTAKAQAADLQKAWEKGL